MNSKRRSMRNRPSARTRMRVNLRYVAGSILMGILLFGVFFMYSNLGTSTDSRAAVNYTWTGATNTNWTVSSNWSPAGVPDISDNVTISNSSNAPQLTADITVNNLTLNNNSTFNLRGRNLTVAGIFIMNAGSTLDLDGANLNVNGNATLNGGNVSNGFGTSRLTFRGTGTYFGNSTTGPQIDAVVDINSASVTFRNSVFNKNVTVIKTGSTSDNSNGANQFDGVLTITNNGTGHLLFANSRADIFNQDVILSNGGPGLIYMAYNDTSATRFNGNIMVSSTSGAGIQFGSNNGKAVLAAGKTINTGAGIFNSGTLLLKNFTQEGNTPLALALTGNGRITVGPSSSFGGNIVFSAPSISLNGGTFNGSAYFLKTGTTSDIGNGGNTFQGSATLVNEGSGNFGSGNSNPDIFYSSAEFNNTGTGHFYMAHASANNHFYDNVIINNSGSAGSGNFYITEGTATASAEFFKEVTVVNGGTATGGLVRFNLRGTTTFQDHINISSTVGVNSNSGIAIGWSGYAGSATLAAGKTIRVLPAGFSNGTLQFHRLSQAGTEPLVLPLATTAGLTFGSNCTIGGNVTASSGSLILGGCFFNGTTLFEKTGSTNDVGAGGNTFTGTCNITNSGSGAITLANSSPDTFQTAVAFHNTGSSTMSIANSANGNVFNGPVLFNNSGTGADTRIYICEGNATANAVFNGPVRVNNLSTSSNALIRFNLRGTCSFNDSLIINSSGFSTNNYGVYFGWPGYTGSATLASNKVLQIGSNGFDKGTLYFGNFTQLGSRPVQLDLTGTASLSFGKRSIFNGPMNFRAPAVYLDSTTFNSSFIGEKTGPGNNTSPGGNIFAGTVQLTNSGSGHLLMGNNLPDKFMQDAVFNNTGSNYMYLAHASTGNEFNGKVHLNNNGSGADTRIFITEGTASASAIFKGRVRISNVSNSTIAMVRLNLRGTCEFQDDIFISSTGGTGTSNNGIYFGLNGYAGTASVAAGKTIKIDTAGFSKGDLHLINFTQFGNAPLALTLGSATGITYGPGSILGGNLSSQSGALWLNGCEFKGSSEFTRTGSGSEYARGGNIFTGASFIHNTGGGVLSLGRTVKDVFQSDLTINNSGTGQFLLAEQSAGNEIFGSTIINNSGGGTNLRVLVCESAATSSITFHNKVTVNNTGTATDGLVRFHLRGTCIFNGDLELNSSIGNSSFNGIDFGWPGFTGAGTLANGKSIRLGSSGISKGYLLFENFTQTGSTAQQWSLTGTAVLYFGKNSSFGSPLTIQTPSVFFNNCRYASDVVVEKTGSTNDVSSGENSFEKNFRLTVSGSGNVTIANSKADRFDGDLEILQGSSGIIALAQNDASGTQFNGNLKLSCTGTGSIRFGQGSGTCQLASGKQISVGAQGFANGDLYLRNFVQLGSASQDLLAPSGVSRLYLQSGTQFNGQLNVSFPQLFLNGFTTNATTILEKNGASNNSSNGSNVFNGSTLIKNSGSGSMLLATSAGDDFNASVTFQQSGTGVLNPAYNQTSTFADDISTLGSGAAINFAVGSGIVLLDGSSEQKFLGDTAFAPRVRRLSMNNTGAGLSLQVPLSVYGALTLTRGKINTYANYVLTVENGVSSVSGVSNSSFVNGPIRKIGNQAFTFPVGKNSNYRPIAMSAPASSTEQFVAEYIASDPNPLYNAERVGPGIHHLSRCEYWSLRRNAGATNVHVTLSWDNTSCGVDNPSDLRVARWDSVSTQWMDQGNGGVSGTNVAGTVVTATRPTVFGIFTLSSSTSNNALPIELILFTAKAQGSAVKLDWKTAAEINNDYFTIERSSDGISYDILGTRKGAGNSTTILSYSMVDEYPLSGLAYYRLKQTDYDGKFEYFGPVKFNSKATEKDFQISSVSPNPFRDKISIEYYFPEDGQAEIQLMNASGSIVFSQTRDVSAGSSWSTMEQLEDLPSGVYFLKIIRNGSDQQIQKLLKN